MTTMHHTFLYGIVYSISRKKLIFMKTRRRCDTYVTLIELQNELVSAAYSKGGYWSLIMSPQSPFHRVCMPILQTVMIHMYKMHHKTIYGSKFLLRSWLQLYCHVVAPSYFLVGNIKTCEQTCPPYFFNSSQKP